MSLRASYCCGGDGCGDDGDEGDVVVNCERVSGNGGCGKVCNGG